MDGYIKEKFSIDHLLNLQALVGRLDLSQDGRWLAFTKKDLSGIKEVLRSDSDFTREGVPVEAASSRVIVADTKTRKFKAPFPEANTCWGPQWSPDGRKLASYVQHKDKCCLGIWELANEKYHLFEDVFVHPLFDFEIPRWTPDSRNVVVKIVPDAHLKESIISLEPNSRNVLSVKTFSYDPHKNDNSFRVDTIAENSSDVGDLAIVDVQSGIMKRLVKEWKFRCWRVAPDGNRVALIRMTNDGKGGALIVIRLEDMEIRQIAELSSPVYTFNWSPDSRNIAYKSSSLFAAGRLFVVSVDGSRPPRDVTGDKKNQSG